MTAHTTANQDEHYLRPGSGTQTACSCGKSFYLSTDATQHIEWQLKTQAIIAASNKQAAIAELEDLIKDIDPTAHPMSQKILDRIKELRGAA